MCAKKVGFTRKYLSDMFHDNDGRTECLNGHVLNMYLEKNKSNLSAANAIGKRFLIDIHSFSVKALVENSLNKYKNMKRQHDRENFQSKCLEVFHCKPSECYENSVEQSCSVPCEGEPESTSATSPPTHSVATPNRQQRGDPDTPVRAKLKRRLEYLSTSSASSEKKYKHKLSNLRKKIKLYPNVLRVLTQKVARKDKCIRHLRQEMKDPVKEKTTTKLQQDLGYYRRRHNILKTQLEHNLLDKLSKREQVFKDLKRKLSDGNKFIAELQAENSALKEQATKLQDKLSMSPSSDPVHSKRDKKTYSTQTRLMVYDCIINQVPTSNVCPLLKAISNRLGIEFDSIPQRHTVDLMVRELGVISQLQSAEVAMQEEDITLGFDATTQEGVHVNVVHLTTKDGCQVIAIDDLPGGTASDYQKHICESIDSLAATYAAFHQADYQECRNTIISHVSNTMTDRAAVNHATVKKVCQSWDKTVNELNCHLHPLDSIASGCRSALKSVEEEVGSLKANDCMAANVVVQMDKLRYRDAKGDPKGFSTFLHEQGLPAGLLPRYRGNRLHIFFHICGIFIRHYSLFHTFLDGGKCCGGLRSSLFADFSHPVAVAQFCVLGMLGKLLTGPWMRKFYASAQNQIHHLEGILAVQEVRNCLVESAKDPLLILKRTTDFFGEDIEDSDKVWKSLIERCSASGDQSAQLVKERVTLCLDAIIAVINRQYQRYFSLDITEELKKESASARLHNIDAEEMMGMFSAAKHKAPGATLCYLSSKLRAKKNGTAAFLDRMTDEEREKVIRLVPKLAVKKRDENRKNTAQIWKELSKRARLQKQKQEDKARRDVEKEIKTMEIEKIKENFPDLDDKSLSGLTDVLSDTAAGREIFHRWFDNASQTCVLYNGKIEEIQKKKKNCYVVAYWEKGEHYDDDAERFDMSKFALAADIVTGDLAFA